MTLIDSWGCKGFDGFIYHDDKIDIPTGKSIFSNILKMQISLLGYHNNDTISILLDMSKKIVYWFVNGEFRNEKDFSEKAVSK